MKNISTFLFLALIWPVSALSAFTERIINFHSDITIYADSQMRVHETIIYALPSDRHGIFRDFPTHYVDTHNIHYNVGFKIESVTKDGAPVPYTVSNFANGKRVKIGDPDLMLAGGAYTYEIVYTTNRQLGYFENHDELYWNVTGNGWRVPIERASVQVKLPDAISENLLEFTAFTGHQRETGTNYQAATAGPSLVGWTTTQKLFPGQGLTIVLKWPKGYMHAPTFFTKLSYFIKDNAGLFWLLLSLLTLLLYCFFSWYRINKEQNSGTVIPLFYPPKDFTPGAVRYLTKFGYDHTGFAAEIINMAVHGFLTIEYKKSFLSNQYTLKKTGDGDKDMQKQYQPLLDLLFKKSDTLTVQQKNQTVIASAILYFKDTILAPLNRFFDEHIDSLIKIGIILFVGVVGFILLSGAGISYEYFFIVAAIAIFIVVLYYYGTRGYTKLGRKLHDEIEGFKLFLETTETERLKIIGTPPTRTPELYEKYLPYAVALGVEQQWSHQFAPIFAHMAQQGHPYHPIWYVGDFNRFGTESFASGLGSSLASSVASSSGISSSGTPPGSSSGFGGGGSSGGGGGGGGGGSW